jgi:hypothetical protein
VFIANRSAAPGRVGLTRPQSALRPNAVRLKQDGTKTRNTPQIPAMAPPAALDKAE